MRLIWLSGMIDEQVIEVNGGEQEIGHNGPKGEGGQGSHSATPKVPGPEGGTEGRREEEGYDPRFSANAIHSMRSIASPPLRESIDRPKRDCDSSHFLNRN